MSNEDLSPVEYPEQFAVHDRAPREGIGLCLSGGGYRAMLFHAGALWRLNELGYLKRLNRISSVSGGSITAGQLGLQWKNLTWQDGVAQNFVHTVIEPIRRLADETIDVKSVIGGVLMPWVTINDKIVAAYRKSLYGDATLQDLPDDTAGPRFVINATNVQSGAIMRFSRPYIADYRVGRADSPTVPLAVAVAASSAFPPVLSPARLKLPDDAMKRMAGADLFQKPYTTDIVLTDGGVYDNLGLETVWKEYKTVIVSDGGGQMAAEPDPKGDWVRHSLRVNDLIDNQVRALRKRLVVGSLVRKERSGVYWRMRGDISKYKAPGTLSCPEIRTLVLAETPTRLAKMDALLQERIINWGYAIADAGMRAWVDSALPAPRDFPYPTSRV
jgi:NTE family protein